MLLDVVPPPSRPFPDIAVGPSPENPLFVIGIVAVILVVVVAVLRRMKKGGGGGAAGS